MKKAFKKAISILLVAVMVLGAAPLAGFVGLDLNIIKASAEEEIPTSGTCGENLTWTFNEATGTLTVSGEGDMAIYLANAPWKSYCSSIISVTIGNGVTSIGDFAFYGCTNLESVTIPVSIATIGHSAFFNCTNLENLTIPDSVTSIDDLAFYNCTSLESVTIPDSVITIGEGVFELCSNLVSVTIPDSITTICTYTFGGCTNLTRVTIPDSVTTIGNYAFGLCQSLESVTIPDSVKNIGDRAFYVCRSLKSITIPDGVTSIGAYAFYCCDSLESIAIPDSVTSIGESAFAVCPKLTRITVSPDNTAYSSDEYGTLFDKDKANLIQYPCGNGKTSYKIPDGVTSIGTFAFAGGFSLESVVVSKSVEHIKFNAFYSCTSIEDVYYGGSKSDWEHIVIGGGNEIFDSAKIHYNSTGPVDDDSTETPKVPDNTPDYDSSVVDTYLMPTPTQTTISYGDSIVLHIDPSKIPEGGRVEWYPSNEKFSYSVSDDGTTCTITPDKKGDTAFTAIVYDAEGNIVSADTQTMTSKAGFFDKIIAFFKKLFGLTKTIPEAIESIY